MNKIIKIFLVWLSTTVVIYGFIVIDATINPWVKDLKLEWYNIFTSEHYMAVQYLNQPQNVIAYVVIVPAILTLIMARLKISFFRELNSEPKMRH